MFQAGQFITNTTINRLSDEEYRQSMPSSDSVLSGDGVTVGDVLGYSVVFPLFGVFSLGFCVCCIGKERFGWFFNKEVIKKKKGGRRE